MAAGGEWPGVIGGLDGVGHPVGRDIGDAAVEACNKTMAGQGGGEPLADRVKKMISAFEGIGVTSAMVEKRLGHKLATIIETELVGLRKIWKAISDNMQSKDAFFGDQVRERASVDTASVLGKAEEKTTAPGGTAGK